jgi:hypothetical protein
MPTGVDSAPLFLHTIRFILIQRLLEFIQVRNKVKESGTTKHLGMKNYANQT